MSAEGWSWLKAWGPAFLAMAAIYFNSSLPKDSVPDLGTWDLFSKKTGHFLEFGILGATYLRGLSFRKKASPGKFAIAVLLGFIFACSDEWHQSWVPGRQPALMDVVIDTLGTWAGVYLGNRYHQYKYGTIPKS